MIRPGLKIHYDASSSVLWEQEPLSLATSLSMLRTNLKDLMQDFTPHPPVDGFHGKIPYGALFLLVGGLQAFTKRLKTLDAQHGPS